jgi:ribosomal protein L40E
MPSSAENAEQLLLFYKTPEEEKKEEEQKEEAPQVRMCFRCGMLNTPDSQFCRRCKTPLIIDKSLDR